MAIFTGNTVDEAIERGLKKLGVKRETVHIQIHQKDKKGFLGIGKKRARIQIDPIHEETVRQADRLATRGLDADFIAESPRVQSAMEATVELSQVIKAVKAAEKASTGDLSQEAKDAIIEEAKLEIAEKKLVDQINTLDIEIDESQSSQNKVIKEVAKYLTIITQDIGVPASVSVRQDGNLTIFTLKSSQDGLLIGKHGKILQALQVLAKAYANSLTDERVTLAINVGDYHEKRKVYITSLAHHAAKRAAKGEVVYINDLQGNERKIVHAIIAREAGVSSHSTGRENGRYIIVTKEK
ncbi:protein jag [Lactococcus carnosus]|uniref:RNA-binding protein KhpB n=1 Tax=Pseudolactococcus carnosus TaxID=2749961 RepID=A0ABT0ATQ7_9LACT|nr:Jag N-terminal domain-containing protein [Lactococcus carnosus]MCJ1989989.1 KH domain-containing protein [Lactococcus carnosus]MCJ2003160.1 KH domain-containing protein [Lactococcus carnosus]